MPRKGLKIDIDAILADGPLRRIVRAMVEPDPTDRLASAAAVLRVLDGAALGGAIPSATRPRQTTSQSVATQPDPGADPDFASLSKLPAFFRFFVWIAAWAATSLSLVVEFVGVPAVFALRGSSKRYRKSRRLRRLKAKEAETLGQVHGVRSRLQAIATQADPWRTQKSLTDGTDHES